MKIAEEFSLQEHNTLRLPSVAQYRVCPRNRDELHSALSFARERNVPLCILGGGSNVVLPGRLPGLVLHPQLRGIDILREDDAGLLLRVGAGESWPALVNLCLERHWYGLENLALIPGSVGAAPVQNIGAYGVELAELLHGVETLDTQTGEQRLLAVRDCGFAYRDSAFRDRWRDRLLICALQLRLSKIPRARCEYPPLREALARAGCTSPTPEDVHREVTALRRRLPDPAQTPNAGSFFRNPELDAAHYRCLLSEHPGLRAFLQPSGCYRIAAGWLLEQAGWRGRARGAVAVHHRHALVLINRGGAAAAEVLDCARAMQESVRDRFGIVLEIEPRVF